MTLYICLIFIFATAPWAFTFVVEQKTFILSRSGKLIFAEIAPHFAENIDSFSAHPIRLTFDGDGSNFLLIHLITPTFGFKSGLSHKILQTSPIYELCTCKIMGCIKLTVMKAV